MPDEPIKKPTVRALQKNNRRILVEVGGAGERRLMGLGYTPVEGVKTPAPKSPPVQNSPTSEAVKDDETDEFVDFLNQKTKTQLKDYAAREFHLKLDVNLNKKELVDQIVQAAKNAIRDIQEDDHESSRPA